LNNKCILNPKQNGTLWSSDKLPSVEVENDECVNLEQNMEVDAARKDDTSIIEPCNEDLSTVAPYFRPSFNFASYVNNSPTLQELVKLGVNLHILEKKKGVPEFILQMEFNKDMKEHVR
jgi:mTERF domain-containing protein